jgi:hypothetical protein
MSENPVEHDVLQDSKRQRQVEGVLNVSREADCMVLFDVDNTDAKGDPSKDILIDKTMSELLKDYTNGMSQAWVVKIEICYQFSGPGQTITFGTTSSTQTRSIGHLRMMPGYTSITTGTVSPFFTMTVVELVPRDRYSWRIQPTSSELPMFKIQLAATAGVSVGIRMYFSYLGVRELHDTLKI